MDPRLKGEDDSRAARRSLFSFAPASYFSSKATIRRVVVPCIFSFHQNGETINFAVL
ncbi:hypothetical protein AT6N2_C0709 [Agrobacterium tumefaciens]|nr:hypothetical protein AT6N2_C0709 [Agrobacterium tumefaciens]